MAEAIWAEKKLKDTRTALVHILAEAERDREKLIDGRTALLHILEDAEKSRKGLEERTRVLEETTEKLTRGRAAVLHILTDVEESRKKLMGGRSALLHILEDSESGRKKLLKGRAAMLHIMEDLEKARKEVEEYSKTLEEKVAERTSDLERAVNKLTDGRVALIHILDDSETARRKLIDGRTATLHIMGDLHKTSRELEEAKGYTDNIIKSMIDTLIVVDPDGKIKTLNKATEKLLRYNEDELIGKSVSILFAEEEEEEEEEEVTLFKGTKWEKLLKEGSVRDYSMTYQTKNGENIPVSFSGSVMRGKDGSIVGIVGIARDMREILKLQQRERELAAAAAAAAQKARVSALEEARAELEKRVEERTQELKKAYDDLKNTQEQLVQAEKMSSLGIMAGGVAHELNNPLGGVLGFASILSKELPKDDPHREDVEEIERGAKRCKAIVENLLKFSRQESFGFHSTDINKVVEESLSLLGHQVELANIKITKNFSPDIPPVMANAQQLQQVFINIISNAYDAMPDGGNLTISTKLKIESDPEKIKDFPGLSPRNFFEIPEGKFKNIEIYFTDTGKGIPKKLIGKIFDPFVTTKPVGKGTGLGLSVSYGIIEKHNGKIEAQSKEGKGTTFTVVLPIGKNGN
ncbi:MAG: PAS domain S-box protein [Deltaproteobacteria bacterium]|nr:PAS domain S-box protein [Deltaproteobacteria bacterium]